MKQYLHRYTDDELQFYLETIGATLIIGPKWCGKTTTAKQYAKTVVDFQNEQNNVLLSTTNNSVLFESEKPILFDEWQEAPKIWDTVRYNVDENNEEGLYILTGSSAVDESKIMHSGAGRIHRLNMKPMSLYESLESNGKISLIELFNNPQLNIDGVKSDLTVDDLFFAMSRGGWPESINRKSRKSQLEVVHSYLDSLIHNEMSRVDNVKRDPDKVENLIISYARNVSSPATDKTIIENINAAGTSMSATTYYSYINALEKLFIIETVKSWSPNIRSKTAIRNHAKKQFIDPSIAVAALGLNPESLNNDLKTAELLFKNLCMRDLSIYTQKYGGKLLHYMDRYNLEVDCILRLRDGRYALIEVKLGSEGEEIGARNLLKLNNLIIEKMKKEKYLKQPSFLAIITSGKYAYTRPDGVKVIPIGCLKQ